MRKRVLVCAALACALSATNASAQMITNTAKRAGIGGSVGAIFTLDDDVNVGAGFGINAGLAPAPGLGPTIGFGWYEGDLTLSGISGDAEVGTSPRPSAHGRHRLHLGERPGGHGCVDQRGHQLQLDPAE